MFGTYETVTQHCKKKKHIMRKRVDIIMKDLVKRLQEKEEKDD